MTHADITLFLQLIAAAGAVITPAALWWLSKYFAPKCDFDKMSLKVDRIEQTLIRMESQQEQIDDHEERLRAIEHTLK